MTIIERTSLVEPVNTEWAQLGDVVDFLDHQRRPITAKDRIPGPIPYYGANGQQDSVANFIFNEDLVLLAEDGGHFDNPSRGIAYRISGKSWVNNHAHVLRPRKIIDVAYLSRVLENMDVTPFLTGSTRAKLTKGSAQRISFPLPPVPEQRRIAAILDKADSLRTQRHEALAYLDALTLSIYSGLQALENHPNIPLSGLLKLSSGKFLPAKEMTEGGAFPVYGGNGVNGFHDEYLVEKPTIVIGRVGAYCGAVHLTSPKSWVTDNALMVRLLRSDVDLNYLTATLKAANLNQYSNQSGQPSISGSKLYPVRIPFPPLELQQTFARRVAGVERLKERHRTQLAELDALFAALQHRAFTGKL